MIIITILIVIVYICWIVYFVKPDSNATFDLNSPSIFVVPKELSRLTVPKKTVSVRLLVRSCRRRWGNPQLPFFLIPFPKCCCVLFGSAVANQLFCATVINGRDQDNCKFVAILGWYLFRSCLLLQIILTWRVIRDFLDWIQQEIFALPFPSPFFFKEKNITSYLFFVVVFVSIIFSLWSTKIWINTPQVCGLRIRQKCKIRPWCAVLLRGRVVVRTPSKATSTTRRMFRTRGPG